MHKIKYMSEIWVIIACVVYIFNVYISYIRIYECIYICSHEWCWSHISLPSVSTHLLWLNESWQKSPSYLVTTTTCILTWILSLSHVTHSNRLKFEMSILWEIVILVQIRRKRLTCSVGPVGQGPWRLMSATELRRSDGAVAGPRRIGLPRPRNVKVHVNSHPSVLTLLSAEGLQTFPSHQMLFRPNSSRNVLYYWLILWSAWCVDEC